MRKFIIPIQFILVQFILVMLSLAFSSYAEEPKEKIKNSLGMEFVLIKPGKFLMGSPEDEPGRYSGYVGTMRVFFPGTAHRSSGFG